jgi:hypothetical protein
VAVLTLSDRLAIAHQKDVAATAGGVTSGVVNIAMGADPLSVSTWFYAAIDALTARIQAGYALNRRSAMGYLPQHGALNGVTVHPVPGSLDTAALKARLNINGPVAFKTAISAGRDEEEALRSMATQMGGLADEMVRNGDRDVITNTALRSGSGVIGWRRHLAGKSCGFCSMLASRGAVYVSRASATVRKDGKAFHPHCRCWPEPLYRHEQEPPEVQRLARQWRRVTAGKHGKDAQRAWRHHWEQRATPQAKQRFGLAAAEPGPSVGGVPQAAPGVTIRPQLLAARGTAQLSDAFRAETKRITGHEIPGNFTGSLQTAREHAEGILRGLERFPDVHLRYVSTTPFKASEGSAYAHFDVDTIRFNYAWAGAADRAKYLKSLSEDVSGWDEQVHGYFPSGWHPRGTGHPTAIAIHEFGHALDLRTLGAAIRDDLDKLLVRRAAERDALIAARRAAGEQIFDDGGVKGLIETQISGYALKNRHELVAEAFADAMMNGEKASSLSREVFDLLEAEYRSGRRATGVDYFAIFRTGVPAASEPAPLSAMKVTELRALAKERGLTGYSKLTKPQLLERLGGEAKPVVKPAAAADLSKLKVTELRALAKERGVTGYSKLTKPQLLERLGGGETKTAAKITEAPQQKAKILKPAEAAEMQQRMLAESAWTPAQREALKQYTAGEYAVMNAQLRGSIARTLQGTPIFDGHPALTTQRIKDALAGLRPLERPVRVFRHVDSVESLGFPRIYSIRNERAQLVEQLRSLIGKELEDAGFSSASIRRLTGRANKFGNVRLDLEVPAGTPAAFLNDISINRGEGEILLAPGLRFEFIGLDETGDIPTLKARVTWLGRLI